MYDNSIIRDYAQRLNEQADLTPWAWGFIWAIGGAILGYVWGTAQELTDRPPVIALVAALFAIPGIWLGRNRAYWLRLKAQETLCQVEIEEHLRAMRPPAPKIEGPPRRAPRFASERE